MGLLTCSRCKQEKPGTPEFFPLHKNKNNGLDSWCRSCRNEYRKHNRFADGIVDFKKANEAKNLIECIICGLEKKIVVDHNHVTGEVRGGLCDNCNIGLGHFKDNPELLRLAALYLEGKCECGNCEVYWGGNLKNMETSNG